eukprot:scaffold2319_cov248-Pinguiococcus_pyrenoidosus.AAC.8
MRADLPQTAQQPHKRGGSQRRGDSIAPAPRTSAHLLHSPTLPRAHRLRLISATPAGRLATYHDAICCPDDFEGKANDADLVLEMARLKSGSSRKGKL